MAVDAIPPQLENSLLRSIEYYQAVLQQLRVLANSLLVSDANFEVLIEGFNECQSIAQQHDEKLLVLLHQSIPEIGDHPLYLQRTDLITQILKLNNLLLPKIDGIMALNAHELNDLKNGRAVLGGYKQGTVKHGRIVKTTV